MEPLVVTSSDGSRKSATAQVDRILLELERNLEDRQLSKQQVENHLSQLKVYGRDPKTAGPIFWENGISVLANYGLDRKSSERSREALRCLANAFLLNESSRQTFVDLGYGPKAAERLKTDDHDDEFLLSRMLFLLTYNTSLDFRGLVENQKLDESINRNLLAHSKAYSKSGRRKSATAPIIEMALVETLKLTFNITYYHPDLATRFTPSIEPLINIILYYPIASSPLQSPITYVLNALLNLDLPSAEKETPLGREAKSSPLFPYSNPESVADRLTSILFGAIRNMPEKELDQAAAPLVTLLRRTYELAHPKMKSWMRWILLPSSKERDKPLGIGDTLAARLLRLSCSPNLPTLRDNISGLLFELSDKDASKFVKNIGYGFASGFLMNNNIEIPASAAEAGSIGVDGVDDVEVNPVTGQRLSAERQGSTQSNEPPMTQAEKEREAERLFVLFERLKATGVVDVQNPVQTARDEGRFEELPD